MPTKASFKARWVASVKGKRGEQIEYFEAGTGLVLRINQSGKKTWRVAYRAKGRWRRLKIGEVRTMDLDKARDAARQELGKVASGRDPGDERKARREAGTFNELAAEYIEKHAKKRKRSWQEDERILFGSPQKKKTGKTPHEPLVRRWGHLKVIAINRRDVRDLIDEIAERAPVMANRVLALVRKIWNYALRSDWPLLDTNPCVGIEPATKETRRDRVLSSDEIRRVWMEAEKENATVASLVKLHLLTAQRGGELMRMAWSEVDIDGGVWTIPAERSKNKLPHRVPLSPSALAIVKTLRAAADKRNEREDLVPSSWVFQSPRARAPKPIAHAQKAIERIRERCGFDFRGHDLRRTAASHMTSIGIPRLTVSKILNHAEPGVTAVYDRHSYDAEKRTALNAWARRLNQILTDKPGANVVPFRA